MPWREVPFLRGKAVGNNTEREWLWWVRLICEPVRLPVCSVATVLSGTLSKAVVSDVGPGEI